jgi:hypothetical protein
MMQGVSQCFKCKRGFDLFNRRHHCRSCGRIFCRCLHALCSPNPKPSTPPPSTPSRPPASLLITLPSCSLANVIDLTTTRHWVSTVAARVIGVGCRRLIRAKCGCANAASPTSNASLCKIPRHDATRCNMLQHASSARRSNLDSGLFARKPFFGSLVLRYDTLYLHLLRI